MSMLVNAHAMHWFMSCKQHTFAYLLCMPLCKNKTNICPFLKAAKNIRSSHSRLHTYIVYFLCINLAVQNVKTL
jgi:hypothetical protein